MNIHHKKLVTVVTEAVIEREITHELDAMRVPGYTITNARGKGRRGDRIADWEHGANIRIEIVCDDQLALEVAERLQNQYYNDYAMVLYISDVDVLRPQKFDRLEGES